MGRSATQLSPAEGKLLGTDVSMLIRHPIIPREHGAWAMLLMPFMVGAGVAPQLGWNILLLLLAIILLFSARYALAKLRAAMRTRRAASSTARAAILWLIIYIGIAAILGIPLLLIYQQWGLLPLAAIAALLLALHLWLQERRLERSTTGELLGIAGLSLTAPAAYYAGAGQFDTTAMLLWLLTLLYSGSSVFYVKMKVRHRLLGEAPLRMSERMRLGRATVIYQLLVLALVVGLSLGGSAPILVPVAFLPLTFKNISGALWPRPEKSLRRVGFIELGHAVLFTALLILTFRLPGIG